MRAVLFCSSSFSPSEVDPDFVGEREAAVAAGFKTALFDHTEALEGDVARAVRRVPDNLGATLYRGWMMRPRHYEALYRALVAKGVTLVNDPAAYRFCHHLPESYAVLSGVTPQTVWMPVQGAVDFDEVASKISVFGSGAILVKDYVKSQKHYWNEACFIPHANDAAHVERVVRKFLELQGDDLAEGLVFREYVPLRMVGNHPRSGMPLGAEVRTFWLDGELVLKHAYWGDLGAAFEAPPDSWMAEVAARVPSRFFTMDIALREDGKWTVIELGDGQVAGLPSPSLAKPFFERLAQIGLDRGAPAE